MDRARLITISCLGLLLIGPGFGARARAGETLLSPGEVLVCWAEGRAKPGAGAERARLAAKYGVESEEALWPSVPRAGKAKAAGAGLGGWARLSFRGGADPREVAQAYARLEGVAWAQPNYLRRLTSRPDDPLVGQQWSLSALGWDWGGEAAAAGVVVAIIDSGADLHHPDLAGQLWENAAEARGGSGVDDDSNGYVDDLWGWDFSDAPGVPGEGDYLERDGDPDDESGHGTHVAGIIGALGDNGTGIAGVATGARLMVLRAGFNMGGGGFLQDDDVAAAIVYAADQGVEVINMSFGDPNYSPLIRDVVLYAARAGCTMVAAVGNETSQEVFYPARLPEVIAVGATGRENAVLSFSNTGYSLDLAAPGLAVLSLLPGGGYGERSGTSMAAAHVSGVAAMVLGRHPEYTPAQVRGALLGAALDLGRPGWDALSGAGLAQVAARLVAQPPILEMRAAAAGRDTVMVNLELAGEGAFDLSWGQGGEPASWVELERGPVGARRVLNAQWVSSALPPGAYMLRARLFVAERTLEERSAVMVAGGTGAARALQVQPALDGDHWTQVAQWEAADLGSDTLLILGEDPSEPLYRIPEASTRNLRWVRLPGDLAPGQYQARIGAGGVSEGFAVADDPIMRWNLVLQGMLPPGYLLPGLTDFDGDGIPEVAAMRYRGNRYNPVDFYEAGKEPAAYSSSLVYIPWAPADLDGDGLGELVGVDAQRVRLIEAPGPGAFPSVSVWQQQDAWGGEVADLDGDGRAELLLRSARAPLFQVFESRGDNALRETAVLANPTGGANELGERQVAADLDGDGLGELLAADADGDLFIYEALGDDAYRLTWKEERRHPGADARLVGGGADLDGDGMAEFVVGRLHQDPYDIHQTRWLVEVYQARGDNAFSREWGVEALGGKGGGNGINIGDWDGDGQVDVALALPPHLYVLSASGTDSYGPVWHRIAGDAYRPATGDLDGDGKAELLFAAGEGIGIFARGEGPAPPVGLRARPLDAATIALDWQRVVGASAYGVYRNGGLIQAQIADPHYEDHGLQAGQPYQYWVTAFVRGQESGHSDSVLLRPQPGPRVLGVERLAPRQLGVRFDQALAEVAPYRLRVEPGVGMPSSALLDRSGTRLLLGFERTLPDSGDFALVPQGVASLLGGPLQTTRFPFSLTPFREPGRVVAARMAEPGKAVVEFNRPILQAPAAAFAIAGSTHRIAGTAVLGAEVVVDIDPALEPVGRRYELQIRGVLAEGGGQVEGRVLLQLAAADLSQVRFFPNPFLPRQGQGTFGFLPPRAEVRVFDLSGRLLRVLREEDGDGGVDWDGAGADGQSLGTGVYLYSVEAAGTGHLGKLALIRD